MDLTQIIITIISVIGAGGLGAFLTYKLGDRKQDESEFVTLVKEYKQLYDVQKVELSFLKKEVDNLRIQFVEKDKEVEQLRNQLMIFESSHADVPVPLWLKDIQGKMLFLNSEYEQTILYPQNKNQDDYIGNTDIDVWGKEIGEKFFKNDLQVIKKRKAIQFLERWKGDDCIYEGKVLKYPRYLGKTIIGVGGIILDIKCIEKT